MRNLLITVLMFSITAQAATTTSKKTTYVVHCSMVGSPEAAQYVLNSYLKSPQRAGFLAKNLRQAEQNMRLALHLTGLRDLSEKLIWGVVNQPEFVKGDFKSANDSKAGFNSPLVTQACAIFKGELENTFRLK